MELVSDSRVALARRMPEGIVSGPRCGEPATFITHMVYWRLAQLQLDLHVLVALRPSEEQVIALVWGQGDMPHACTEFFPASDIGLRQTAAQVQITKAARALNLAPQGVASLLQLALNQVN